MIDAQRFFTEFGEREREGLLPCMEAWHHGSYLSVRLVRNKNPCDDIIIYHHIITQYQQNNQLPHQHHHHHPPIQYGNNYRLLCVCFLSFIILLASLSFIETARIHGKIFSLVFFLFFFFVVPWTQKSWWHAK